jgi:hypothetical protein
VKEPFISKGADQDGDGGTEARDWGGLIQVD